ncbi:MAG: multicopper oxidase domain-containing protein [Actinobacteria bacterium]|nr:multicopper oxidase domain-containing protein [Actinomycetota bacterium]
MHPARIRRSLLIGSVAAAALLGSLPTSAKLGGVALQAPQACSAPTRSIDLFAERLGKGRVGYGLTPGSASIPGPTLEMTEGECLAVTLRNGTTKRVSMHSHGVDYTVASDGTRLNSGCVRPGAERTYIFDSHEPTTRADGTIDPGSAGYWHYHDHCRGSPHGTAGINAGLFGALIVRRQGDPLPDREPFVVVMGPGAKINLKRAPRTPTFRANMGERVEFVVIGHGDLLHTFHLHGHRWVDNRTGLASAGGDETQIIDNRTIAAGDSFGFQVVAGEGVGPGAWMYHCHIQNHSDAGMGGIFLVADAAGNVSTETQRVLRSYRRGHSGAGQHPHSF